MSSRRLCVFCGDRPVDKNNEHVLPQWLLQMTGDPNRVVKFGTNYSTGDTVEFAWSSFVVPACSSCNGSFSTLESATKLIVEKLLAREPVRARDYLVLLDWLDKVRVGLWIAYSRLQRIPSGIQPNFYVESRIGTKDRLVALYPLDGNDRGLNAFGVESLVFHGTPSCCGLRINSLLILTTSADYLFSGRCGFPFPKVRELLLDGQHAGRTRLSEFQITRRVRHPIMRRPLHKPSVLLYQPIMHVGMLSPQGSGFLGDFSLFDSFLADHTLPPYPSGKGILFRQYLDKVLAIRDMSEHIEFDSISGQECTTTYQLLAQVYDLQSYIQTLFVPVAESRERKLEFLKVTKMAKKRNAEVSNYLKQQSVRCA